MDNCKHENTVVIERFHDGDEFVKCFNCKEEWMQTNKKQKGAVKMGIIKKGLATIEAFVVVAVGIGACTSEDAKPVQKVNEIKTAAPATKEAPKEAPKKQDANVTKSNYDKIIQGDVITGNGGTTEEEVRALMATEPTFDSVTEVNGTKILSLTFNGYETGEVLTFTFTNGKVSMKAYSKF